MMLSCEQVIQEVWVFLDGQLDEVQLVHFRQHMELCRACFSRVEFERALRHSIRSKTTHGCPEKLKRRVRDFLEEF